MGLTKTVRRPEWDFVKGLLIIFVVWGHICAYISGEYDKNTLTAVVRLYQMPMFILVSGFFQKECNSTDELKKRILKIFNSLVIPYAVWILIALIADCVSAFLNDGTKINSLRGAIVAVLDNANILWYLGCLIVFQVVYSVLSLLSKRCGKTVWILSLLALLVCPIDLWYTCFLWPFFLLGRWLARTEFLEKKGEKIKILPMLAGCLVLTVLAQYYPTSLTFYNRKNFFLEGGVEGIFSQILFILGRYALYGTVTVAFLFLFYSVHRRFFNKTIVRLICSIGQRTLGIFVIHIIALFYFFKPFISKITDGKGLFQEWPGIRFYIVATLLTVITVAISIWCSCVIEKNRFCARILLGKKNTKLDKRMSS